MLPLLAELRRILRGKPKSRAGQVHKGRCRPRASGTEAGPRETIIALRTCRSYVKRARCIKPAVRVVFYRRFLVAAHRPRKCSEFERPVGTGVREIKSRDSRTECKRCVDEALCSD